MNGVEVAVRTVVDLDLVGYSDLCRLVGGPVEVLTNLNDVIPRLRHGRSARSGRQVDRGVLSTGRRRGHRPVRQR